jgi:hypothetical protein
MLRLITSRQVQILLRCLLRFLDDLSFALTLVVYHNWYKCKTEFDVDTQRASFPRGLDR